MSGRAKGQQKLPGTAARKRIGRTRRQLGTLRTHLAEGTLDPFVESLLQTCILHADSLDRLERDPDASEHTINLAASQYRQALLELRPYLPAKSEDDDEYGSAAADAWNTQT